MTMLLDIIKKSQNVLIKNSPAILTGLGAAGAVSTAYLTGKATWDAATLIRHEERYDEMEMPFKERVANVWHFYIPPVISGVLTVGCIIGASRVSSKRIAAAYSVAAVMEKTFEEYREKVVEQVGVKKEQAVRDEIAQDRVTSNPPPGLIVFEAGEVLCYEYLTGRYFTSSMERIKQAQNEINSQLIREDFASLDDFYYLIGLDPTEHSNVLGWYSDRLLDLEISVTLAKENTPALVIAYNYTKPI